MVSLEFRMNDIAYKETTIIVDSSTQLDDRIKNLTVLKTRNFTGQWYQLPNVEALELANNIIKRIRYAKFSFAELYQARKYVSTIKEYTYTISSPSNKLYKIFLEEYKKMSGN